MQLKANGFCLKNKIKFIVLVMQRNKILFGFSFLKYRCKKFNIVDFERGLMKMPNLHIVKYGKLKSRLQLIIGTWSRGYITAKRNGSMSDGQ